MSTERRGLRAYIVALLAALDRADPAAGRRLRDVVGARRARIALDDEGVDVRFDGRRLAVRAAGIRRRVDGVGRSDRATTRELLDGYVEVSEAIVAGGIDAIGSVEDVARILHAIEIMIDAATRAPAMQSLADAMRGEAPPRRHRQRGARLSLTTASAAELALLRRLDLAP